MLFTVSFNSKDEQKIMDIMLSHQRSYKFFCCGSLESIARDCGVRCSRCRESLQEPSVTDFNGDCFALYALKSKADTMELVYNLAETGVTKAETTPCMSTFLESRRPVCSECNKQSISGIVKSSPKKVVKGEPTCNDEAMKAKEDEKDNTVNAVMGDYSDGSGGEEEFRTINDPGEDDFLSPANVSETVSPANWLANALSLGVPPCKVEINQDFSLVNEQEGIQNELPNTSGDDVMKSENNENILPKEEVSEANTSGNDQLIDSNNSEEIYKEEQHCLICMKTIRGMKGRSFNSQMSFNILSHSRIHVDTLPLKCQVCGYECRHRDLMKKHFVRHHSNVEPAFTDMISDPSYNAEVCSKARECFPDFVHRPRRDSDARANKRPHP